MRFRIRDGVYSVMPPEEEAAMIAEYEAEKLPNKLAELREEADRRINLVIRKEDIDRLTVRAMYLLYKKVDARITEAELAELASYEVVQQQAEAVRAAELSIKEMIERAEDPSAIDVTNDRQWG